MDWTERIPELLPEDFPNITFLKASSRRGEISEQEWQRLEDKA
jgi:hypothetical protein